MAQLNLNDRQIKNRNFLSPTGFKFTLSRAPKVAFFSNSANMPGLNFGVAIQPTYLKDIPTPGDKIEFEDVDQFYLETKDEFKNSIDIEI